LFLILLPAQLEDFLNANRFQLAAEAPSLSVDANSQLWVHGLERRNPLNAPYPH
jgi:hypothetical protein